MQEFSSVTASSYDAESLAPMLTEKASEGWSVVSIVSAGTNVVAYLTRGGDGAQAPPAAVTADEAADQGSDALDAGGITEIEVNEEAAAAVAAEATAISPSLPSDDAPADEEPAASTPEAVAAVEASGEPSGWGAVADTSSEQDSPSLPGTQDTPTIPDSDDSGLGALAGGIGAAAGAAAVGGAALAGDESSDSTSDDQTSEDSGDSATDNAYGMADSATDATQDAVGSIGEVLDGSSDAVDGAAEHAGGPVGDDTSGFGGSIGDATSGAADVADDATAGVADVAAATDDDAAAASGVPAGWYADPSGRFELRYWDGSAWTEHVSRAGQQYTDPPVA